MMSSWNALTNQVYVKISEMSTAVSSANAAAGEANTAAKTAADAAKAANEAAAEALEAAEDTIEAAEAWNNATAEVVETLDPATDGDLNSVTMTNVDGRKHFAFKIVKGERGKDGAKGETGKSGVKFSLAGSALYITTQ